MVWDVSASPDFRKPRAHDRKIRARLIAIPLWLSAVSHASAEPIDYEKQIKPIFAARCTACHGVLKQEGGLRLDTGALARQGGDSGKVIAPGNVCFELLDRADYMRPIPRNACRKRASR